MTADEKPESRSKLSRTAKEGGKMLTMPRAEGLVVAFSSDWNAKDEGYSVIRDVAALANTVGGDLYVGIGRDGHVVGVDDPDRLEQCVLRAVRHDIQPSLLAFVSAERISVEGKHVLRVHVDAGTGKPYCLNPRLTDTIFVRRGNRSVPATPDEVAGMVRSANPIPFEERISLEQGLDFEACRRFFERSDLAFDPKRIFGFWNKAKGAYTNLAYLCSDQSAASELLIEFADEEKTQILRSERVTGSVFDLYERASEFLAGMNGIQAARAEPGSATGAESLAVAPGVISEALVNMLVHRDYAKTAPNVIHVTPRSVRLFALGGFGAGLSAKDVVERMGTDCKNPGLSRLFTDLKLRDNLEAGLPRIRAGYKETALGNLFSVSETSFTITLPRVRNDAEFADFVRK